MSIGESLLSNVLPLLFEKLASPVISELSKLYGVKDEIAKLRRTVERLQAMLHDAEQKKLAEGRQGALWLQEIQRALYAAEDLVDEFEYEGLRRKVMKSSTEGRHGADGSYLESFMSGKLSKLCSCLTPQAVSFRHQMARKIDDLRRKLDEISKEKKDFKLGGALGFKANLPEFDRPAETTALLGTPEVFGRDEQDLSKTLKGKRFLLVLDDVWEVDQNKWKAFSAPLAHGGRGSQVLITTRNANVANILKPKKIELQVLSPPDSWSIFKTYAFTHAHHSGKYQILEPIGKEIVNKLKGVPLALSVIGGLLGSELDERKWRAVLDSKLWELEQGGHGILPALKLS
ncbi:hypothetical protein Taro_053957 [Colocasia esculenta]|uniref:Uncharacterized protein n=1 Tax=Colocasia esculenta TaxID=4460 RepID=A0A843XPR1_COLES|nr:hypothetical protein [Colocasia esculenta]